jgi:hypothetical protein
MTHPKRTRHSLDKKKKFIELRARGLSLQAIAKALKMAKGVAVDWNKEFREEVAAAHAIELEALQEEYYLTREAKIRLFGEKVRALLTEVGKRDLSDMHQPPDRALSPRTAGPGVCRETGVTTAPTSFSVRSILPQGRNRAG